MNFEVFTSSLFEKELKSINKKYPSLYHDLASLISALEENPFSGSSLGKNCYKIRMAITSKGKGKSGGARIITCVKVMNQSVFLLSIYDKSEKETTEDGELIMLLKAAGLL